MSSKFNEGSSLRKNNKETDVNDIVELRTPLVSYINMDKLSTEICIKLSERAVQEYYKEELKHYRDMAEQIKKELDEQLKGSWNVIVGNDFGSYVSFEKNCAIQFCINTFYFLIWRHA